MGSETECVGWDSRAEDERFHASVAGPQSVTIMPIDCDEPSLVLTSDSSVDLEEELEGKLNDDYDLSAASSLPNESILDGPDVSSGTVSSSMANDSDSVWHLDQEVLGRHSNENKDDRNDGTIQAAQGPPYAGHQMIFLGDQKSDLEYDTEIGLSCAAKQVTDRTRMSSKTSSGVPTWMLQNVSFTKPLSKSMPPTCSETLRQRRGKERPRPSYDDAVPGFLYSTCTWVIGNAVDSVPTLSGWRHYIFKPKDTDSVRFSIMYRTPSERLVDAKLYVVGDVDPNWTPKQPKREYSYAWLGDRNVVRTTDEDVHLKEIGALLYTYEPYLYIRAYGRNPSLSKAKEDPDGELAYIHNHGGREIHVFLKLGKEDKKTA